MFQLSKSGVIFALKSPFVNLKSWLFFLKPKWLHIHIDKKKYTFAYFSFLFSWRCTYEFDSFSFSFYPFNNAV